MRLNRIDHAFVFGWIVAATFVLCAGCNPAPEDNSDAQRVSNEEGQEATQQRFDIESEEDARIVLDEPLFDEVDAWSGFYHATQQEGRRIPDGDFRVISKHSAPDFPDALITTTYEGQFSDGVRHGEFTADVESPEGETRYRLLFGEEGTCTVGYIDQRAEGISVEEEVSSPRPCTFAALRDTLYAP